MFSSRSRQDDASPPNPPLAELRLGLDRIEALVAKVRDAHLAGSKKDDTGSAHGSSGRKSIMLSAAVGFGTRKSAGTSSSSSPAASKQVNPIDQRRGKRTKSVESGSSSVASKETVSTSTSTDAGDAPKGASKESLDRPTLKRSPGEDDNAEFIRIQPSDEEELIELLRRSAELVVHGERQAARGLGKDASRDAEKSLAVFEYFCERNALTLVVNIVTGVAFRLPVGEEPSGSGKEAKRSNGGTGDEVGKAACRNLLPPLSVATQAVQSASILISNVVRATSLYFLLSNNVVNDLINLPLQLYAKAEDDQRNQQMGSDFKRSGRDQHSAEMSELTTHFVSFLKSLAMRMNAETLQFFLTYPSSPSVASTTESPENGPTADTSLGETKNDDDVSGTPEGGGCSSRSPADGLLFDGAAAVDDIRDVDFPLYVRALHYCSRDQDSFVRVTAMNICLNTLRLAVRGDDGGDLNESLDNNVGRGGIHGGNKTSLKSPDGGSLHDAAYLPFRERLAIARHVCAPSRVESLVSPIFMRLAQLCGSIEEAIRTMDKLEGQCQREASEVRQREEAATVAAVSGESGTRAVAQKSASEGGSSRRRRKGRSEARKERKAKEEAERKAEWSLREALAKVKADFVARRRKSVDTFQDTVADLQDELLLLEDVLKVGLTAVNEQTIEMMLATFIYPVLLQPLYLYMQRYPAPSDQVENTVKRNTSSVLSTSDHSSVNGSDSGSASDDENDSNLDTLIAATRKTEDKVVDTSMMDSIDKEEDETHPFSLESITNSLSRYGILGSDIELTEQGNEMIDSIQKQISSEANSRQRRNSISQSTQEGGDRLSSNPDPDPAPAKTAIFAISAVFHTITNRPLLNLLFTAMLHPLAPDSAAGGKMVISPPGIVSVDNIVKRTIRVRVDAPGQKEAIYNFGKVNGENTTNEENSTVDRISDGKADADMCVFVLSPALADIFESTVNCQVNPSLRTRANPYRRVALACLAGTHGMSTLQSLSVLAIDAALAALGDQVALGILFGSGSKNAVETTCPNHMVEVIAALSVSVVTASLADNGIWQLDFDRTAAHALLCASAGNCSGRATAAKLIEHRRRQSSTFLSQLPARIDTASLNSLLRGGERDGPKSIPEDRNEQRLDLIMDRIFFDPFEEKTVLEYFVRKRVRKQGIREWAGPCCVPVATKSSLDDVSGFLCQDSEQKNEAIESHKGLDASIRVAARSALAHLQLDAFSSLIKEGSTDDLTGIEERRGKVPGFDEPDPRASTVFDMCSDDDLSLQSKRSIFAQVSQSLSDTIFEEEEVPTSSGQDMNLPETGSIVGLVGRAAFPCVCEVANEHASLFTDKGACVVAEGVKWQSLYLVIMGRYMILAEPEKGGSGGNGRIVTACHLSHLLAEKDNPPSTENASPARRLLLTHASLETDPPGVFIMDSAPDGRDSSIMLTRSRMDLWFEDATAVGHAYRVLSSKVNKARSRRGHKILEVLAQDDRLRISSLFDGS